MHLHFSKALAQPHLLILRFSVNYYFSPRLARNFNALYVWHIYQVRHVWAAPAETAAHATKIQRETLAALASPATPEFSANRSSVYGFVSKIRAETTAFVWRSPRANTSASVWPDGRGKIVKLISTNARRILANTAEFASTALTITPAYATEPGTYCTIS